MSSKKVVEWDASAGADLTLTDVFCEAIVDVTFRRASSKHLVPPPRDCVAKPGLEVVVRLWRAGGGMNSR